MDILINDLNKLQDQYGFLPEEELIDIADHYNISKGKLYGIITFYSRFYLKEKPKYIIRVCESVSCSMNKSKEISEIIMDYLNLNDNNETYDRKFKLEYVECLGHCNLAPVISINDEIYGELTEEKIKDILESLMGDD
jgi:NADH-quinone oxidoreductase subunit E